MYYETLLKIHTHIVTPINCIIIISIQFL